MIRELESFGTEVDVHDPHADPSEVWNEYAITLKQKLNQSYAAIVLAVSHNEFKSLPWATLRRDNTMVYDVKAFLPKDIVTERL